LLTAAAGEINPKARRAPAKPAPQVTTIHLLMAGISPKFKTKISEQLPVSERAVAVLRLAAAHATPVANAAFAAHLVT
jgi:hypothetical protein